MNIIVEKNAHVIHNIVPEHLTIAVATKEKGKHQNCCFTCAFHNLTKGWKKWFCLHSLGFDNRNWTSEAPVFFRNIHPTVLSELYSW